MQLLFPGTTPQQTVSSERSGGGHACVRPAPWKEQTPSQKSHITSQRSLLLLPVCDLDPHLPSQAGSGVVEGTDHLKPVHTVPLQGKKTSQKTNSSPGNGTRKPCPPSFFIHNSSPQFPPCSLPGTTPEEPASPLLSLRVYRALSGG